MFEAIAVDARCLDRFGKGQERNSGRDFITPDREAKYQIARGVNAIALLNRKMKIAILSAQESLV
jgi:hypothetical protein